MTDLFGYTTPKQAAITLASLHAHLAATCRRESDRLESLAARLAGGGFPPRACQSWQDADPLLPPDEPVDWDAAYKGLVAYTGAASSKDVIVSISLDSVLFTKRLLGRCREHTIIVNMDVEWIAGIEAGVWGDQYNTGTVLAIMYETAAIGHVTKWTVGCGGSGSRQLMVVNIADLRARQPDYD